MVDVSITETDLAADVKGADLIGSGSDLNTTETFDIAVSNRTDELVLVLEEQDGAAATVTIDAGDEPPSMRAGLGALTITLAANDLRLLQLSGGRFIQSDGKITGSVTGGVRIRAVRLARTW